ncbi:uncharacterized protein LOC107633070 [Arachis ipaensis]|uniref:uncharacterized protein LOC107633070 n=1 Tax=Arachis ipaensis TaxID=130454 RepID=UPI0007AEFA11|nr:uncharacterized protein LOC107633070 [Arachis ipaensis]XP_025638751.1 uncharacterized protein LOC112733869 [Arachis hypogaea]
MAEENQRMENQIVELTNAWIENNDNEQWEDDEENSDPTHIYENQQPEKNQQNDDDDKLDNAARPFIADMMNFMLPRNFTLPLTLTPYDDGPTLDWFSSFHVDSISHFYELAKQFEYQFAASSIYLHDFDYLNTVKEGQHKSLKDYITHFTKVAMSFPNLHPKVHLHAIKSGLCPEKFQEAITVAKLKTLAEFREKAKGLIEIEELCQTQKSEKNLNNKDEEKVQDNKKPFWLAPRYDSYTQLNTKREEIIKEILNTKLINPPRKAGTYQDTKDVDKTKYYTFNQKHEHTTDECIVAKDLFECLACQGHLDKYILVIL